MLMHSFDQLTAPPAVLSGVRHGIIPAFCLFKDYNVRSLEQIRELCLSLYAAAREGGLPPPIIGIDQEGGQLIAVDCGATELPGNMALGATRSPQWAAEAGRILGRELLALGINMNFAPSLDINSNPFNPAIGTRSFGDDPHLVAELGTALIEGMQAEGVLAVAKHFPGSGDTDIDSHYDLPIIRHNLERLHAFELLPFRSAVAAETAAIMSAHLRADALDPVYPATLSSKILIDLLRREMGFQGLIITDAMDMQAVARMGAEESVRRALQAGVDLVLLAHLPDQLDLTERTRLLWNPQSLGRIQAARARLRTEIPPLSVVGSAEHQAIAQRIADASVTLTHGSLPLPAEGTIAVITVQPCNLTPADSTGDVTVTLAEAIRRRRPDALALMTPREADDPTVTAALEASASASIVIVGTNDAYRDPSQQQLIRQIKQRGQRVYVVTLRTPYDAAWLPFVDALLCVYSVRAVSCEAAARALFGELIPTGTLPCSLPHVYL